MRILVATDGSDPAAIGVEAARALATLAQGEIRIVAVLPPTSDLFGGAWPAEAMIDPEPLERAACAQLEERLGQEVQATPADLRPTSVLRHGRPATEIVAEAVAWKADVIVVGSRGHGPLSTILIGSVSEEVVDGSPIPVLVARRPAVRRVLVAVDGSEAAAAGVAFLASGSAFHGVETTVLNVTPTAYPWWLGVGVADGDTYQALLDASTAAARAQQAAAERATRVLTDAGIPAIGRRRAGDPAEEIVREAAEHDADLVVIGSRGRTGVTRLVLGSVARQVLRHAATSVLVVHEPALVDEGRPVTASRPIGEPVTAQPRKETPMKILLAYDGGEPAKRALHQAATMAKAMNAAVDVVSVVPVHPGRVPVDPWDDREVHDAELRGGTIHAVQMIGIPGAEGRTAILWWKINPAALTIVDQGVIDDGHSNYGYPSVAVNRTGGMLIAYSTTSGLEYPSAHYVYVDATGNTSTEGTVKSGVTPIRNTDRWGDYTTTVLDPADDKTFWTVQISANNVWETWWAKVKSPDVSRRRAVRH